MNSCSYAFITFAFAVGSYLFRVKGVTQEYLLYSIIIRTAAHIISTICYVTEKKLKLVYTNGIPGRGPISQDFTVFHKKYLGVGIAKCASYHLHHPSSLLCLCAFGRYMNMINECAVYLPIVHVQHESRDEMRQT